MPAISLSPRKAALIAASVAALTVLSGCAGTSGPSSSSGGDDAGPSLVSDGTLTVCGNLGSPPNIYAEEDGTPIGAEVDLARAMSAQLGLELKINEYAFSGLIPALQARQCDTIISSLYIKPEREEVADFVPYLLSGSGVAVSTANPAGVTGYDDSLCGVKAIAITGATGATLLEEKSAECTAAGKDAIDITLTDRPADALQQVIAGQMEAFVDTSEIIGFYEQQSGGQFVAVGDPVGVIQIGAATLKDNAALHEALQKAFDALVADGTYAEILQQWGLTQQDIAGA